MSEQTGSWQPDPFGRHQYRYWDGAQWTDQVSNDGAVSTDPATADVAPAAAEPAEAAAPAEEPAGWAATSEPAPTQAVPATDPTIATPTYAAPAPPATPGGPGYYDPPPAATGGSDGGGGSKLPLIIVGVGLLALILGAGAYFLFFSGDDDADRSDLIAALRGQPFSLSSSEAECVVDEIDDVSGVVSATREGNLSAAQQASIARALSECNVDESASGDDIDDDTTTTTDPDDDDSGTGTSIPNAMLDAMAQGIMAESGMSQPQARCFAEEIFNLDGFDFGQAISDPEAFQDQMAQPDADMMMAFFEIFERCDIDPMEFGDIGGGSSPTPGGGSGGSSYGDDATLDALWDGCEGGDMGMCDDLYFASPSGSDYERFADTCGGRQEEGTGNLCTVEFG